MLKHPARDLLRKLKRRAPLLKHPARDLLRKLEGTGVSATDPLRANTWTVSIATCTNRNEGPEQEAFRLTTVDGKLAVEKEKVAPPKAKYIEQDVRFDQPLKQSSTHCCHSA